MCPLAPQLCLHYKKKHFDHISPPLPAPVPNMKPSIHRGARVKLRVVCAKRSESIGRPFDIREGGIASRPDGPIDPGGCARWTAPAVGM